MREGERKKAKISCGTNVFRFNKSGRRVLFEKKKKKKKQLMLIGLFTFFEEKENVEKKNSFV